MDISTKLFGESCPLLHKGDGSILLLFPDQRSLDPLDSGFGLSVIEEQGELPIHGIGVQIVENGFVSTAHILSRDTVLEVDDKSTGEKVF